MCVLLKLICNANLNWGTNMMELSYAIVWASPVLWDGPPSSPPGSQSGGPWSVTLPMNPDSLFRGSDALSGGFSCLTFFKGEIIHGHFGGGRNSS